MKKCSKCKQYKDLKEFNSGGGAHGKHAYCKPCNNISRMESVRKNGQRDRSKESSRNRSIKNKYGITTDQFAEMLVSQRGRCAICGGVEMSGPMNIDHCHETGRVRGLLCSKCNHLLGNARDDQEILNAAIVYLSKFESLVNQNEL